MKIKKLFLGAIFVILFPFLAFAKENSTTTPLIPEIPKTMLKVPATPLIISKIKEAKQKLSETKLNFDIKQISKTTTNKKSKKKKTSISYILKSKDIALAVFNPQTENIDIVLGIQTGKTYTFNYPDFDIKLKKFNGVNSLFEIKKPDNGYVLALKYLISPTEPAISKNAIQSALYEAVYVPFSNSLNTEEVANYGENYLSGIISEAAKQISNLPSASGDGKKVTEVITPSLIKALIYAEHMNAGDILNSSDPKAVINRLNTLFAINEGDTYRYSVSSAGARGLAQFMPKTYKGLAQRHWEANLTQDFIEGMSDHTNAVKAMYLLLDDYGAAVKTRAKDAAVSGQLFDYGAASYNGGVARVAGAVKLFGQQWNLPAEENISKFSADVSALATHIKELSAKITKAKDLAQKKEIQASLVREKEKHDLAKENLKNSKKAGLRTETVVYLQKIYKVISVLNNDEG